MTDSVTVVAHITAQPAWAHEVQAALLEAMDATQDEQGCVHYRLYQNLDVQEHWTMLELWSDEAALAKHMLGAAFKKLSSAIEGKASVQVVRLAPVSPGVCVQEVEAPGFWLGNGLP